MLPCSTERNTNGSEFCGFSFGTLAAANAELLCGIQLSQPGPDSLPAMITTYSRERYAHNAIVARSDTAFNGETSHFVI